MEANRTRQSKNRVTETILVSVQSFAERNGLSYQCRLGEKYLKLNGYTFTPEAALAYLFGFNDGKKWNKPE